MSVRGGRGASRLFVALALALFLLPLLPQAPAQSARDPWWGPADRSDPTKGWAVRIPISVENRFDWPLQDAFVAAEIDFGSLLVQAGWTNQTVGTETRLRGFTLDVDSIRVIEYNRGFLTGPVAGASTGPTPHVFYPALLESPRYREFHPERNPAGTVLFQIPGELRPQEKRAYYVYANPLEFGKTAPPKFDLLEKSPLDAFLWGTQGVVALGYEPQQEGRNHGITIRALSPGETRVTVSTYGLGRFTPIDPSSSLANPFTLQQGQDRFVPVPAGRAFKVEATKPVAVSGRGDGETEIRGYVPGRSGSFADDVFDVFLPSAGGVQLHLAKPGTITITSSDQTSRTLSNGEPVLPMALPAGWSTLRGTGPFTVGLLNSGESTTPIAFPPHQVPAVTGGPSGNAFFSYLSRDKGYFRLCPEALTTLRVVDQGSGGTLQIYPEGTLPSAPAKRLEKQAMCTEVPVPRTITSSHLFEFYSSAESRDPVPNSPVPFRLFVGTNERVIDKENNFTRHMIGHYGGLAGADYYVYGDTGLFGHYNNTRITIFEEKIRDGAPIVVNRTRELRRDEFYVLQPSDSTSTGRFHLVGTKPFAAASLAEAQFAQVDERTQETVLLAIAYVRHVPGRPVLPSIAIGAAEFRGPLVELRSPETDARQIFRSTGPGSPLSFRLDAMNLGRWIAGDGLTDTIIVRCTTPTGWSVEGCDREINLGGGTSERLNIVVTPSTDDVNATRTIIVEARSRAGGVAAIFKLIVYVEIRYGVGMWFDVEGGRKTIDPPIGLDPGETYRYNIIVKNTGSTQDTFALSAESPREGWEQELLLDNEPVKSVRLEGGASKTLQLRVKAPNAEQAPQNIVAVTAQSQSSALAADVVNTATRIRPKVDLDLTLTPQTQLAEPEQTARFNLTIRNKGNDVFTVILRQDSILPKGWESNLSLSEITLNPNPSNDPALNYGVQVQVKPSASARAGDLASLKIAAEIDTGGAGGRVAGDEVSAVVVVRRVFDLATPPVFDAEALPGQTLIYHLPVRNQGNGQVAVEILPGASQPAWPVSLAQDGVTLGLNESADLELAIDVPPRTPPGTYNFTFTTRLSREAIQNLSVPINVRALARVDFAGPTTIGLTPGRPLAIGYRATNAGNVEGVFDLATVVPAGWNATLSPAQARLAPGDAIDVLLTVNATRDAPDASYPLTLRATAEGHTPFDTNLTFDVKRPALSLVGVNANGALRPGELVLVTASVANRGGIDAHNVSVALAVDGRVVDKVLLTRVPVGTTSLATLSWVSTQRGGDVRVLLDPEEEIALPARGEATSASVEFGSRLGVPGPALVLLIALAGVLALARDRRRAP